MSVQNQEYAAKRKSLRIDPPTLRVIPRDEYDQYRKRKIADCGQDGQFKILQITDDEEFAQEFKVIREISLNVSP